METPDVKKYTNGGDLVYGDTLMDTYDVKGHSDEHIM